VSLKQNVIANYFGQGWRALMAVAFVPLYIEYLGVEAYGLIGIFAILQAWLALLDMGMKPALGREMARFSAGARDSQSIRDLLRSVEIIAFAIAAAIALAAWAVSGWLASDWLTAERLPVGVVAHAFVVMGAIAALRFISNIYLSCIVGLQRQVLENVLGSITATVQSLGAVAVLKWVSPTIQAFFLWQAAISMVTVALYVAVVYRALPPAPRGARFSRAELVDIWRFAAGMMANTLLALLLMQVDKILLSRLLSLEAFSYYAFAWALANTLFRFTGPITTAFYPRFIGYATRHDPGALRTAYHQGAQLVTVFVGAGAIVLMTFGDRILLLWTGNHALTQETSSLLPVLALGTLLNSLMWIPYHLQLAHGWTSLSVRINLAAVALLIPALFWLVPAYGAIGAAWTWVALNAAYVLFTIYFMHRRLLPAEKWRWYARDVAVPLIVAAASCVLLRWTMPRESGKLVELAIFLLAAGCALVAAALAAPLVREQLVRHVVGASKLVLVATGLSRGGK
jgi:O-antigen/teichoic acid export membrane protein